MKNIGKNEFARNPKTARIGKEILPLEMGYLPEFFRKKAEVELGETPEKVERCIKQLREMAEGDPRLKDFVASDDIGLQYLRMRKYNVSRAHETLRKADSFIRKYSECVTNFNYEETIKVVDEKIVTVLPWRCQDGCAVVLLQLENWDPEYFPVVAARRMVAILLFSALQDPMTQVNGFKVIFDVKIPSLRVVREFTPNNLWMLYFGTQECTPGRFKEFHVVNDSLTFKSAWIIVKQFLPDKLKRRVHFHSRPGSLLKYFPSAVLPARYGGEIQDPFQDISWFRKILAPERLEELGGGIFKTARKMVS